MYRLPFGNETGWILNKGNHDDVTNNHSKDEYYAFDFNHIEDGKVVAARGGKIVFVENSLDKNVSNLPDNDPDKMKYRSGNYVIIRHKDGTFGRYCHFKKGGVMVKKNNWITQGQFIGYSGNTGWSTTAHLHFETRIYWNSLDDYGPTIPVIFEDNNHSAWRPQVGDSVEDSNNTVLLDEGWTLCSKCQGLFYGRTAGQCPSGGLHTTRHGVAADYVIVKDSPNASGQHGWSLCNNCNGLYLGRTGSVCPNGGLHKTRLGGADYMIVKDSPNASGQHDWRWCHKCHGLFFGGNPGSHCPFGGQHDKSQSGDYALIQATFNGVQSNWRWCHKCQGLSFGGSLSSKCPADSGKHSITGSTNYYIGLNSPAYPGTHSWHRCNKCQGLFLGGNFGSHCPAGGEHNGGSADYCLTDGIKQAWNEPPGQQGWSWCTNCQGLFYSENPGSKCPALPGQSHALGAGGQNYGVMADGYW